ncbi:hypothetical protein D3C71_1220340 [compost metagenome]
MFRRSHQLRKKPIALRGQLRQILVFVLQEIRLTGNLLEMSQNLFHTVTVLAPERIDQIQPGLHFFQPCRVEFNVLAVIAKLKGSVLQLIIGRLKLFQQRPQSFLVEPDDILKHGNDVTDRLQPLTAVQQLVSA